MAKKKINETISDSAWQEQPQTPAPHKRGKTTQNDVVEMDHNDNALPLTAPEPPKRTRKSSTDGAGQIDDSTTQTQKKRTRKNSTDDADPIDDSTAQTQKKRTRKSSTDGAGQIDDSTAQTQKKRTRKNSTADTVQEPIANTDEAHTESSSDGLFSLDTVKLSRPKGRMTKKTVTTTEEHSTNSEIAELSETTINQTQTEHDSNTAQEDSATSSPDFSQLHLSRPKGRIVRKRLPSVNHTTDTPQETAARQTSITNATYDRYAIRFIGETATSHQAVRFDAKILPQEILKTRFLQPANLLGVIEARRLVLSLHRRRGVRLNVDAILTRAIMYSGMLRNHPVDRAPVLRDLPTVGEIQHPMPHTAIDDLTWRLYHTDIRSRMAAHLAKESQTRLFHWYRNSDDSFAYTEAAAPASAPNENAADATISPQPSEDEVLSGLMAIFDTEPETFISSETTQSLILKDHIDRHVERLTALFCDWARGLRYIDAETRRASDEKLLARCFAEYFDKMRMRHTTDAMRQNVTLPDDRIQERFHLDHLDMVLIWMLVSLEANPNFRNELTLNWTQQTVVFFSAGTAMRFMASTAKERNEIMRRLSPSGFLAVNGLIKVIPNSAPNMSLYYEVVISEEVRNLFCGVQSLSLGSTSYAELQTPHFDEDVFIAKDHIKTFDIIKNFCTRPLLVQPGELDRNNLNVVPSLGFLVEGLPGSGRTTLIKIIASKLNRPVILVQCSPLGALHPTDCEDFLKSVFSDAQFMDAFVCLRDAGVILTDERLSGALARQLARYPVICAVCVDLAVKTLPVIDPYITFKVKMDANLRDNAVSIWEPHLELPHIDRSSVDSLMLSQTLALQPFQIQKAAKLAYYSTNTDEHNQVVLDNENLRRAAAIQVTKNIGNLAFVTDPEVTLDDVIVSDDIMTKIQQIIGSAINRRRVLYEWGLSRRIRRGTGVIALFDGEPGTGKTHSAEAIAKSLGLSLMRVNIATMVDKYIGETEKNLTTIFEQARPDMQLLLFDEADSLFTKRTSNVSKSNDRYSNMSVNVLLQLVERYEGVSILTTNLKNAIDPAFERRITYKVYFPMPKKPERERLWKYMCPPDILTSEPIDYEWLSELEMSGGEIKNAVLTAAFQAATKGVLLNSEILYDAGVSEASAAGRVMRRYNENSDDMFS